MTRSASWSSDATALLRALSALEAGAGNDHGGDVCARGVDPQGEGDH